MNKKLIAVAIGAALSGSAFAQSSNVTLYGRINTAIESNKIGGQSLGQNGSETSMRGYSSRLGVRGVEDLGGGLKGVFGIEASLDSDDGDTSAGSAAGVTGGVGFGSLRNSYVGLDTGSTGRIVLGRLDAAVVAPMYQQLGSVIDLVGMDAGNFQTFGSTARDRTAYVVQRTSNAVGYNVKAGDFDIAARYSMNGTNDAGTTTAAQIGENNQRSLELTAGSKMGALSYGIGYESAGYSKESEVAGERGFKSRIQAVVGYTMGDLKVGAYLAQNKIEGRGLPIGATAATNITDDSGSEYGLSATYAVTPKLDVVGNYLNRDLVQVTAANGVVPGANRTQFAAGTRYKFSKRTNAYALYGRLDPSDKAANNDIRTISVGVMHNF